MAVNIVQFVSRNKDNKDIADFKERRKVFLTEESFDSPKIEEAFKDFCSKGLSGEVSRYYYSVNSRDADIIRKNLITFLVSHPEYNICKLNAKIVSIAMKPDAAKTKHWMFDFDINDELLLKEFCDDIMDDNIGLIEINAHKTVNGYAVVIDHGFDTRALMKKWADRGVSLKRDDMLLIKWDVAPEKEKELEENYER